MDMHTRSRKKLVKNWSNGLMTRIGKFLPVSGKKPVGLFSAVKTALAKIVLPVKLIRARIIFIFFQLKVCSELKILQC